MKIYKNYTSQIPKLVLCFFIFFIFLGSIIEIFSLGLLYPLIGLLSKDSIDINLLIINKPLEYLNNLETSYILYMFLMLLILKNIFLIILNYFQFTFIEKFQSKLSKIAIHNYCNYNLKDFKGIQSSVFIRNINTETLRSGIFLNTILQIVAEIFLLILIVALSALVSSTYTLIVFLSLLIIFFAYYSIFQKKFSKWAISSQKLDALRIKNLQYIYYGFKDIRSFSVLDKVKKIFYDAQDSFLKLKKKSTFLQNISRNIVEIIIIIFVFFLIVKFKENLATNLTKYIFLVIITLRFLPSLLKIINFSIILKSNLPAVNIVDRLVYNPSFQDNKLNKTSKFNIINITNIKFKYDNDKKYVLNNLSITINKNKIIGIKGPSGSGKSTLINILGGLVVPESINIKMDNRDLNQTLLSNMICFIHQDGYIFDKSLRFNLTFNDIKKKDKLLMQLITKFGLKNFFNNLKQGLDSNISESGMNISGGEKQRLLIIRAFLVNKPIYIFDEFTNALDKKNEDNILSLIKSVFQKNTVIIVSHKFSTLSICDKIYEMKKGKLQ